jgi:hypothetical protein
MDRTNDVRFFQDLTSRAIRPDIAPDVKALLDHEAAEKAAAKNKLLGQELAAPKN